MTTRPPRGTSGHTLLELLVVMVIMTILMTLMTEAFRPLDRGTLALRDRARAVNELRLATDALAADLGRCVDARMTDHDELVLTPEPALLALDPLRLRHAPPRITYALEGGDLRRTDAGDGSAIVVARDLRRFELLHDPRHALRLTLGVGDGDAARTVHLLIPD
ncbi:MAG: type II secretion system protein [Planctomycetes bacterium]|nr:type II secretion system protein [Planctomycetota bacterium]